MTFSWRRRRAKPDEPRPEADRNITGMELTTIPVHFLCPISLDLMRDPVTLPTGITYDRESIETWLDSGNRTCPVTNRLLPEIPEPVPNHSIRKLIQDWCVLNRSWGIERIPTPRVPVAPHEVSEICSAIDDSVRCEDAVKCRELVGRIKYLARDSERNRRCMMGNGLGPTVAGAFDSFAARFPIEGDDRLDLLKEILSVLTWTSGSLGEDGASRLKSTVSLRCMARFLRNEDNLSSRQNAMCVLRDLMDLDRDFVRILVGEIEGVEEAVFRIVKVPIGSRATKAGLTVIQRMMTWAVTSSSKFVRMGLIPSVLEIIVDGDKSACEKALGVLDTACGFKEGREIAYENALVIPLLVKKILRVSEVATGFCVSSLWKLLCLGEVKERGLVEAAECGGFQKLLLVLQIGSSGDKEKVTELLKAMNACRGKVECFDSSLGFRYVKRSLD
ncbi:U-box domain-containing family protein [Striga asiatica]|uniref:U-box domain-containing protein n=1 Tax=Striga asiatica TaxID=4170 RepID=A0A5A7PQ33_STRAF|nr:U-box domain-containing family protein [Striga asiatica]